jgi:predicted acyl esterase
MSPNGSGTGTLSKVIAGQLIDVYPPTADSPHGYAMHLTGGILRMCYHDSWETPTLSHPGQEYAIRIEVFPCRNWFAPGHRIRLDISTSHGPHFDLNFNTGELDGLSTHARMATHMVYVDQARPSHVALISTADGR